MVKVQSGKNPRQLGFRSDQDEPVPDPELGEEDADDDDDDAAAYDPAEES